MKMISPSQGLFELPGTRVIVEGKLATRIAYSSDFGGRWFAEIRDGDDESQGTAPGLLAINKDPRQNPGLPRGVFPPRPGLTSLLERTEFQPLFTPGRPFRAEAVIGIFGGRPWFNISEWMILEPNFPVGVRQIIGEPSCLRRLMLSARGIRGMRSAGNDNRNRFLIGEVVHQIFQSLAVRGTGFGDIHEKLEVESLSRLSYELALKIALSMMGAVHHIDVGGIRTALKHIRNLVESPAVRALIENKTWFSEVPAAHPAMDGVVDLKGESLIIELKSDREIRRRHVEQLRLYLVAEILKHGISEVVDRHKAFIVRSSSETPDDASRVLSVHDSPESLLRSLDTFIDARHRYLLTGGRVVLPKIDLDVADCEDCPFFPETPNTSSPCHFYCQTDRSWNCKDCRHSNVCTQSHIFHSFQVLDDANKIRIALQKEIQSLRNTLGESQWQKFFQFERTLKSGVFALNPRFNDDVDPPTQGSLLSMRADGWPFSVQVEFVGHQEDLWLVAPRVAPPQLEPTTLCSLSQTRSRVHEAFSLLSCVDQLQRVADGSSSDGIAFAGGRALSRRLPIAATLEEALHANIEDVFCQSFNPHESRVLLNEYIDRHEGERTLIVTHTADLAIAEHRMLRLDQIGISEAMASQPRITSALAFLKDLLSERNIWSVTPRLLFSDVFKFLPSDGLGFFEHLVFFETPELSPLEYFSIRNLAQRRVCIGDANTVGRKMTSDLAIENGLGHTLLHRVLAKGFIQSERAVIVNRPGQKMASTITSALKACKLTTCSDARPRCDVSLQEHDHRAASAQSRSELTVLVDLPSSREIRVCPLQDLLDAEITEDVKHLPFNLSNKEGDVLTCPVTGNRYKVMSPPTSSSQTRVDQWSIRIERTLDSDRHLTNDGEAELVAKFVSLTLAEGTKPKNIAVMSPAPAQLLLISEKLGASAKGIAFRTPYALNGEQWGTTVISCAADEIFGGEADRADPRVIYTMIRTAIQRAILFGNTSFINNHPFLRHLSTP